LLWDGHFIKNKIIFKVDKDFGIRFDFENKTNEHKNNGNTSPSNFAFYARDMRFLGGDSTSDLI